MDLLPLANAAFDAADFAQAEKLYRVHVQRNQGDCNALTSLAAALYHLNRLEEAIEVLQYVLMLNESHCAALLNMSVLLNDQGRGYESSAFSGRLILHAPKHTLALMELGYAMVLCGCPEQALKLITRLQPPLCGFFAGRAHFIRGKCWELLGDLEPAERAYMAAVACQGLELYQTGLTRVRTLIWRRRLPVLCLREQAGSAVARLNPNLFALLINHC